MTEALPPFESPDSASPLVTRLVAAGLRGEACDGYTFTTWQKSVLRFLGRFPQGLARFAISRFQSFSGLDPRRLVGLSADDLARARLQDYAGLHGPFPCITTGAALGGASAHLSLALGGPFLPQAFVTTLRGGSPNGDVQAYFLRSAGLAQQIAAQNPGLLTIQHYDPIHDGWLTRFINHLRFKLLDLPASYVDFIRTHLQPGGAVCYLDCGAQWLRYRVKERSVFQVGGWGDISPEEFLEGSERIQHYCRLAGLRHCDWRLLGFPLEQGPESEWGCEPSFGNALQAFCEKYGYQFVRIRLPHPHDYSRLAFHAIWRLVQEQGQTPAGVQIEMFSQFDPWAVFHGGLLPVWLVFNTLDSLAFLKEMRPAFPPEKPVFFSPLATFSLTPDLAPYWAWEDALRGLDWCNVGARPTHYPADSLALVSWQDELREWVSQYAQPIHARLKAEELLELAGEMPIPGPVDGL